MFVDKYVIKLHELEFQFDSEVLNEEVPGNEAERQQTVSCDV